MHPPQRLCICLPLPWNALLPDIYTAHSLHSGLSSNVISSKIFLRVTSSEKISLTNHCLKSYPQHTCTKSLLCLCLPVGLPIPIWNDLIRLFTVCFPHVNAVRVGICRSYLLLYPQGWTEFMRERRGIWAELWRMYSSLSREWGVGLGDEETECTQAQEKKNGVRHLWRILEEK